MGKKIVSFVAEILVIAVLSVAVWRLLGLGAGFQAELCRIVITAIIVTVVKLLKYKLIIK
jgi:hypothetical protein